MKSQKRAQDIEQAGDEGERHEGSAVGAAAAGGAAAGAAAGAVLGPAGAAAGATAGAVLGGIGAGVVTQGLDSTAVPAQDQRLPETRQDTGASAEKAAGPAGEASGRPDESSRSD